MGLGLLPAQETPEKSLSLGMIRNVPLDVLFVIRMIFTVCMEKIFLNARAPCIRGTMEVNGFANIAG